MKRVKILICNTQQIFFQIFKLISLLDQDKHKWILPFEPKKSLLDTFDRYWICTRCNCERLRSKYDKVFIYSRSGIHYGTTRPDCFGDTPINEQTID